MKLSLLKISFSITLLGILLLLFISTLEPKPSNISDITQKQLNKKVKIQGTIFNIRFYNQSNFQVISVRDQTGKVDITSNKILNLKNNQNITVIGKIKEYKQFLQVQAEKITFISSFS